MNPKILDLLSILSEMLIAQVLKNYAIIYVVLKTKKPQRPELLWLKNLKCLSFSHNNKAY